MDVSLCVLLSFFFFCTADVLYRARHPAPAASFVSPGPEYVLSFFEFDSADLGLQGVDQVLGAESISNYSRLQEEAQDRDQKNSKACKEGEIKISIIAKDKLACEKVLAGIRHNSSEQLVAGDLEFWRRATHPLRY